MRLRLITFSLFLLIFQHVYSFGSSFVAPEYPPVSDAVHDLLAQSISLGQDEVLWVNGEKILSWYLLKKFYEGRDAQPAWIRDGHPTPAVKDLLNAVQQADREGLNPTDYHLAAIKEMMDQLESLKTVDSQTAVSCELLLSDAFFLYGADLLSGRINPYDVDDDWFAGRRTGNLPAALERAFEKDDIRQTLKDLLPTHPVYQRMRNVLARYRQIEKNGGWPKLPDGSPLKLGDKDPRIILLRQRLHLEGYLNQKPNNRTIFDVAVERALIRYQKRNGLDEDGVLGKSTIQALNIPVNARVHQIRINMERCRWLPDNLGERYVFVNVPAFKLQVYEGNHEAMAMKVVVGRKMRQTPVFSSTMTHIIFNPPWNVPIKVARLDILDHIREEPDYLVTHNFEVYEGYDESSPAIDPVTINWSSVTAQNLHYKFRQKPGPLNALGRIKFLLPNRFDVYLHDTPSRSLFSKTVRDFSSGCIRIEKPVELALYLLSDDVRWKREKIEAAINKGTEQIIPLPKSIPVHLMYWTAWVDEQDNVQFREDIYGRDESLNQAINREPSS